MKTYDVIIGSTHVYVEASSRTQALNKAYKELDVPGSDWDSIYSVDYSVKEI